MSACIEVWERVHVCGHVEVHLYMVRACEVCELVDVCVCVCVCGGVGKRANVAV